MKWERDRITSLSQEVKVKSIENPEKNPKAIDSWIESISELHRSKPPATVHYTRQALIWTNHEHAEKCRTQHLCHYNKSLVYFFRPMPDIDSLMQEWPPEFEELLGKVRSWLKCHEWNLQIQSCSLPHLFIRSISPLQILTVIWQSMSTLFVVSCMFLAFTSLMLFWFYCNDC